MTNRGTEHACRDRWVSLNESIEMVRIGATGLDGYILELLEELRAYHQADAMPQDVREAYERKLGRARDEDLTLDLDYDDGEFDLDEPIDLEQDDGEPGIGDDDEIDLEA